MEFGSVADTHTEENESSCLHLHTFEPFIFSVTNNPVQSTEQLSHQPDTERFMGLQLM